MLERVRTAHAFEGTNPILLTLWNCNGNGGSIPGSYWFWVLRERSRPYIHARGMKYRERTQTACPKSQA